MIILLKCAVQLLCHLIAGVAPLALPGLFSLPQPIWTWRVEPNRFTILWFSCFWDVIVHEEFSLLPSIWTLYLIIWMIVWIYSYPWPLSWWFWTCLWTHGLLIYFVRYKMGPNGVMVIKVGFCALCRGLLAFSETVNASAINIPCRFLKLAANWAHRLVKIHGCASSRVPCRWLWSLLQRVQLSVLWLARARHPHSGPSSTHLATKACILRMNSIFIPASSTWSRTFQAPSQVCFGSPTQSLRSSCSSWFVGNDRL